MKMEVGKFHNCPEEGMKLEEEMRSCFGQVGVVVEVVEAVKEKQELLGQHHQSCMLADLHHWR